MTTRQGIGETLKDAIRDAARWYAVLNAPDVTPADQRGWQQWLADAPEHRLAWREVERVQDSLQRVPGRLAAPALRRATLTRRQVLTRLGMVAMAAPLGALTWQLAPWERWRAQYVTGIGEQRKLVLADGSQLMLNTGTHVDTDYNPRHRLIRLHDGEILVQSAPDPRRPSRPLLVDTPEGRIQALGTRFTVRRDAGQTRVTVLANTVRVTSANHPDGRLVQQGEEIRFTAGDLPPTRPAPAGAASWAGGKLMVVDMPLRELLAELGRYRRGLLACSDAVAGLRVSGTFPLADTDRALSVITEAFPLRQRRLTDYWVTLLPV